MLWWERVYFAMLQSRLFYSFCLRDPTARRVNRLLPVQHFAGVVVGASLPRDVLIAL
ncbi:hypothetical protein PPEP_b0223 [Pseudoalteromonas peptidolytica F12-50-A1]|uniref:Uncharacterized protein n=1 Tax=Pseudoalteromonas peptidolytica F12-50-A1 TaxID=1315280 RepID=A0A8I0MZ07_9GAMM|nr:hypothetical protein [Pseudoalteromonas peptidolytica F12-50-A1]